MLLSGHGISVAPRCFLTVPLVPPGKQKDLDRVASSDEPAVNNLRY